MSPKSIKIAATAGVLTLAFVGLMSMTLREDAQYYKYVDEVMAQPEAWHGKRLQIHGYVVEKSILKRPDTLEYRFQVQRNGKIVNASYTGVVPDTFKDGSEVVLKGRLDAGGFHVDRGGVVAKCPSKYEPGKS
jgi:cytochrome c-type biogenesis protein CcmE